MADRLSRQTDIARLALQALQLEFQSRIATEPRAAGLVLRVIENLLAELKYRLSPP